MTQLEMLDMAQWSMVTEVKFAQSLAVRRDQIAPPTTKKGFWQPFQMEAHTNQKETLPRMEAAFAGLAAF